MNRLVMDQQCPKPIAKGSNNGSLPRNSGSYYCLYNLLINYAQKPMNPTLFHGLLLCQIISHNARYMLLICRILCHIENHYVLYMAHNFIFTWVVVISCICLNCKIFLKEV